MPTPLPIPLDQEWRQFRRCRNVDPDVFFNELREAEAKMLCADCPVRSDCLEYALKHETVREENGGIWGGCDFRQRRSIKRRRQGEAKRQLVDC